MPSALVWKVIKPKRMRDDRLRLELLNAMGKVGTAMKKDYERTVRTWNEKPEFETVESLKGGPTLLVGTDDVVYKYVDEGTKAHIIRAKNAPRLAFPSVYRAKTDPGKLDAHAGGPSGDTVFAVQVQHPGTEPRDFTKIIQEKWEPKFREAMQQAMVRAARESGHGE